jgi:hypothetical protein
LNLRIVGALVNQSQFLCGLFEVLLCYTEKSDTSRSWCSLRPVVLDQAARLETFLAVHAI